MISRALTLVALITAMLINCAPAQAKSCQNSVCAASKQEGRDVVITLSSTARSYTHFNFLNRDTKVQNEHPAGNPVVRISNATGQVRYAVQVCKRGAIGQRSTCTPWVNFHHDVKPVAGSAALRQ